MVQRCHGLVTIAGLAIVVGPACAPAPLVVDNVDEAGADADAGRDAPVWEGMGDDAGDGGGLAGSGPVTFVVSDIDLLTERLCDLDGDGFEDNAVANLGASSAALFSAMLEAAMATILGGERKMLLHSPWVEDRERPDDPGPTLIAMTGQPLDYCFGDEPDPSDDYSGSERYCVELEQLDECGEPLAVAREATLDDGALTARFPSFPIVTPLSDVRIWGSIEAHSASGDASACGYFVPDRDGREQNIMGDVALTPLEALVGGGAALGYPAVPGLEPDLDLDGDGLEHFVLDGDGHVSRCVDGDGGVIEGRDCWRDPRIVDGISLSIAIGFVSALLEAREPGWDARECHAVLPQVVGFGGGLPPSGKIDDVCPGQRSLIEGLLDCTDERCAGVPCLPRDDGCLLCAETECADALAACLDAPPCCPEPPTESLWGMP